MPLPLTPAPSVGPQRGWEQARPSRGHSSPTNAEPGGLAIERTGSEEAERRLPLHRWGCGSRGREGSAQPHAGVTELGRGLGVLAPVPVPPPPTPPSSQGPRNPWPHPTHSRCSSRLSPWGSERCWVNGYSTNQSTGPGGPQSRGKAPPPHGDPQRRVSVVGLFDI